MIFGKILGLNCLIGLGILTILMLSGGQIKEDLEKDWSKNKLLTVKNVAILAVILPLFTLYYILESLFRRRKKVMENQMKLVKFDGYCERCKWKKEEDFGPHCDECLTVGGRDGSEKPVGFEEAGK